MQQRLDEFAEWADEWRALYEAEVPHLDELYRELVRARKLPRDKGRRPFAFTVAARNLETGAMRLREVAGALEARCPLHAPPWRPQYGMRELAVEATWIVGRHRHYTEQRDGYKWSDARWREGMRNVSGYLDARRAHAHWVETSTETLSEALHGAITRLQPFVNARDAHPFLAAAVHLLRRVDDDAARGA